MRFAESLLLILFQVSRAVPGAFPQLCMIRIMHGRIMVRHRRRFALYAAGAILLAGATWLLADRLEDTIYIPLDHPAIHYAGETADPVGRLEKRLANGQVKLGFAPVGGYLAALLKELNINVDSQA